jgi:hypothetical protein
MNENFKVNWFNIIINEEFQSYLDFKLIKEVSMASKIVRKKLKHILFKSLRLKPGIVKFDYNILSLALNNRSNHSKYEYGTLIQKNYSNIEDSFSEFVVTLNDIKMACKAFYLAYAANSGYYLFPIINIFTNLTDLKVIECKIPFRAFVNIGKALSNLKSINFKRVSLVKSFTDVSTLKEIAFSPNLVYLKFDSIQVIVTQLLSNSYEQLFSSENTNYSYQKFILPKISVSSLKVLNFTPKGFDDRGLEEFLKVNPNLEMLIISLYNLKVDSSLNRLKYLSIDDKIYFDSIDKLSSLNSINTLSFTMNDYNNIGNFRNMCRLCANLVELRLLYNGSDRNSQALIDNFLVPALPSLIELKTLQLINIPNIENAQILDFSKFTQIENLVLISCGSALNIKFDSCESLKQFKFISFHDNFTNEYKEKFNKYKNWNFKFIDDIIKGYKNS